MSPLVLTSTTESVPEVSAPRQDFLQIAEALKALVLYPPKSQPDSLLARLEKRTAADIRQAFAALKHRRTVSVYVSLSEKIGVPLAFLLPKSRHSRPAHVLIAHHLTSPNKRKLHKQTNYLSRFDRIIALGKSQLLYLAEEAGYPQEHIALISHAVDSVFWSPAHSVTTETGVDILAVGREKRDYETLANALRLLPEVSCVVVASSPWSRQASQAPLTGTPPPNMQFQRGLSYNQLRDLYARASLVIVPVEAGTTYAAGATGCLEAMAMARPVLATATPGLADYQHDNTGAELVATIPPGDPVPELRTAIESLLANPVRREQLAIAGRRFVENQASTDIYVRNVAQVVQEALATG